MKTIKLLILIILPFGMINCEKDETLVSNEGLVFQMYNRESENDKTSFTIVQYEEIIGYDSLKYAFKLKKSAWDRLEKKVAPVVPDPNFGFFVVLNNEFVYKTTYIQPYSSWARRDIMTFRLKRPNLVIIELGYPAVLKNEFTGEDLRNTLRLIEQLRKDNKLIEIEL